MSVQQILESLRPYATQPPKDDPPEVLPRDLADPWSLNNAARGVLGLLMAGEKPGPRLYAVADYLLAFNLEGYGAARDEDARLLNGTALALCGYLCGGRGGVVPPAGATTAGAVPAHIHPEAELWRRTGCARLATQVHLRRAALDDRLAAACTLAVCQVADELEAPLLADLITLRERMWGLLLDHGRSERLGVSESEYPLWMSDPVPVDQVGARMAAREWQWALEPPAYTRAPAAGQLDLAEADLACHNLITLRAHMLVRHQFGADLDWHLRLFDDKESTVSLNALPFLRNLALAYAETGDRKYAHHCVRLLWSWYNQSPLPNHWQPLGPWRTLEVGNRQANVWPVIAACLGRTEAFDEATHAMMARSRLDHMRYALAYCGGPNNWYQVEAAGLATAALCSPELRHADAYLRLAMRRLRWINGFAYYDDGFQFELTPGYHVFPTSSMFAVVLAARARGVELPGDFVSLMERAHEMYLYAVQPNHLLPTLNDCSAIPVDPAPLLHRAAEAFQRPDFLWGGTHGAEGTAPGDCSHAWHSAGYYVMRDRWAESPQDVAPQYLFFDGAPWGASHQHEDKLGFVLSAGGRVLLGDPNIYSYARTELTHYFRSSRAHNLAMIDGMGQMRRPRPEARLSTLGRNEWQSRPEFDFVSSEYLEGYAPDPYELPGSPVEVDTRFSQRRAIFYVKPGYWILSDLIRGPDDGPHTLEQLFHIAPILDRSASPPLRAGQVSVSPSGSAAPARILTQDEGLSNLVILPVDGEGLDVRAQKGETSPAVGWYGLLGEYPAWDVTLERRTALPARMDAVLYPMEPGCDRYPQVERLLATDQATAFRITGAGLDDTYILCEEGCGPVEVVGIAFQGRALLLRRVPEVRALAVNARTIVVDGVPLT